MSSSFDLDVFVKTPTLESLNSVKKSDLLTLAHHYKISQAKSQMRKQEIKNILIQYFVDEDIFKVDALSSVVDINLDYKLREVEIHNKKELCSLKN